MISGAEVKFGCKKINDVLNFFNKFLSDIFTRLKENILHKYLISKLIFRLNLLIA